MSSAETRSYPGFGGTVARSIQDSEPWWKPVPAARPGSPNIVVIYMDDLGYADIGCFGSEIETPNIDAIASRGLRFNHYTTHPICSPARAALLTGRNAHSVNTGWLANNVGGFPGYSGELPLAAATLPEALRAGGYATLGLGKWHNSPNGVTPNASWPTQRGFDRFYGFLEGETSYFFPARLLNNNLVAPIDSYPEDYYLTDDLTNKAIELVRDVRNARPAQPFFLYMAYNAVHGPLQAKEVDLAKYRGRYDAGWDVMRAQRLERQKALGLAPADAQLSPRDPAVPAWDSLPAEQRAHFVRHMETYAAMLDCVDQNVGRIVDLLREMGELDNTIIVFSADNGGTSSAGSYGNVYFNRRFAGLAPLPLEDDLRNTAKIGTGEVPALYPMGWGQVSNTPFPSFKTYTGGGGRRVSLVVSWPKQLTDAGAVRTQFAHVTDLMPTLLDLAGVPAPTTSHGEPALPLQGASLAGILRSPAAPDARSEQYYECWANRAYWREGWVAVSLQKRGDAIDFDQWTLHHQASDFSESIDLSAQHPERLAELVKAFDEAAWANQVYPLDNRTPLQKFSELPPQQRPAAQSTRRFLPGGQTVHRSVMVPLVADRCFRVDVRTQPWQSGQEGVLFALGEVFGGMSLVIDGDALTLLYNGFGQFQRLGPVAVLQGASCFSLDYQAVGKRQGQGRLLIDGQPVTEFAPLSPTLRYGFHEGLDIGIDRRAPVDWALYQRKGNFRFTGTIIDLVIESGAFSPDTVRP